MDNVMSKKDIVEIIQKGLAAVVWITEKGAILQLPGEKGLYLMENKTRSSFEEDPYYNRPDSPCILIDGITGLASTDPEWDGLDVIVCDNPGCPCFGTPMSADLNVHDGLWQDYVKRERMRSRRGCPRRKKKLSVSKPVRKSTL